MTQQEMANLKVRYPIHMPLTEASALLGMSRRLLSQLIAGGREPYASLGANIGLRQNYVRVYTGRLMRYLDGSDADKQIPESE